MLSLIDAYSVYNQIKIDPIGTLKTTCHILPLDMEEIRSPSQQHDSKDCECNFPL